MATDTVTLFDLSLAKTVVRLDRPTLVSFVTDRGSGLVERDQRNARLRAAELAARAPAARAQTLLREFEEEGCRRAAERWADLAERLRNEDTLESLRVEIAWAAGTLSNELRIDYWGCFVEVLMKLDVERTCETNLVLDSDDLDGAHVYFLEAAHADAMISSLRAHWSEVTVMKEPQLQRLVGFRDRCASNPALRIAYHIDF